MTKILPISKTGHDVRIIDKRREKMSEMLAQGHQYDSQKNQINALIIVH